MRLGRLTNGTSCEYSMQESFSKWLKRRQLRFKDEVRVPKVHRVADFLIIKNNSLINVEAKCIDLMCLIKQLEDHSIYADYSFAFIPDYTMTPKWFKSRLMKNGFGLIIFNFEKKVVTEVLEAHKNNNTDKELRRDIISIIPKRVRTSINF